MLRPVEMFNPTQNELCGECADTIRSLRCWQDILVDSEPVAWVVFRLQFDKLVEVTAKVGGDSIGVVAGCEVDVSASLRVRG
jgi:hypothetical protein